MWALNGFRTVHRCASEEPAWSIPPSQGADTLSIKKALDEVQARRWKRPRTAQASNASERHSTRAHDRPATAASPSRRTSLMKCTNCVAHYSLARADQRRPRSQIRCPRGTTRAPKKAIVDFVEKVTKEGSPDFVPPAERIATFDNDGTLWAEQPMYFQLALRARSREGARAAASRVEGQGAVRVAAQGRRERRARRRRTRPCSRSSWPPTRA